MTCGWICCGCQCFKGGGNSPSSYCWILTDLTNFCPISLLGKSVEKMLSLQFQRASGKEIILFSQLSDPEMKWHWYSCGWYLLEWIGNVHLSWCFVDLSVAFDIIMVFFCGLAWVDGNERHCFAVFHLFISGLLLIIIGERKLNPVPLLRWGLYFPFLFNIHMKRMQNPVGKCLKWRPQFHIISDCHRSPK